jgi:tetratricopeptide (TPR) repeat protein
MPRPPPRELIRSGGGPRRAGPPAADRQALDGYLAEAAPGERPALLLELVHPELHYRLEAGEAARAEDYLGRYPKLRADPAAVPGLVAAEYQLRRQREPGLAAEEYLRRFPEHAAALPTWLYPAGDGGGQQGAADPDAAAFQEAIRNKPNFPEAYHNLGLAWHHLNKLPDALAAYREALRLKPDYPEAHDTLGCALRDQGKLDQAVAEHQKAIALRPDYALACANPGIALADQGKGRRRPPPTGGRSASGPACPRRTTASASCGSARGG